MSEPPAPEQEPMTARAWIPIGIGVVIAAILVWRLVAAVSPAGPTRMVTRPAPSGEMPVALRTPQLNARPRVPFTVSPALQRNLAAARAHFDEPQVAVPDGAAALGDADATAVR